MVKVRTWPARMVSVSSGTMKGWSMGSTTGAAPSSPRWRGADHLRSRRGNDLVNDVEAGVVVVDEEAEHGVVAATQLADPERELGPLRAAKAAAVPGRRRGLHVDLVEVVRGIEHHRGSDDGNRPTDQARNGGRPGDLRRCRPTRGSSRWPAASPTASSGKPAHRCDER